MSLRELYQEMIVDHGRHPRNFGKLQPCTHTHVGHNPLCGDKLVLYVAVDQNKITQIKFEGEGCAISMASASLMTEAMKGKSPVEALSLFDAFHQLVTEGLSSHEALGKLAVFGGVHEFPMRVKCATLAWQTLKAAILNSPNPVNTENEE